MCILDINECAETPGICKNGGTCVNSIGSYKCTCPQGLVLMDREEVNGFKVMPGETGTHQWNVYRINHTCVCKYLLTLKIGIT